MNNSGADWMHYVWLVRRYSDRTDFACIRHSKLESNVSCLIFSNHNEATVSFFIIMQHRACLLKNPGEPKIALLRGVLTQLLFLNLNFTFFPPF